MKLYTQGSNISKSGMKGEKIVKEALLHTLLNRFDSNNKIGHDVFAVYKGKNLAIEVKTANGYGGQNKPAACYAMINLIKDSKLDFAILILLSGTKETSWKAWPQDHLEEIEKIEDDYKKILSVRPRMFTLNLHYRNQKSFNRIIKKQITDILRLV